MNVKPIGPDYADYWIEFDAVYETAVQTAFDNCSPPLAAFKGSALYPPDLCVAAATAGYELEVSPAEAVGLLVIIEAYAFTKRHGIISRIIKPTLRYSARNHDRMLKSVSPSVLHLRKQPIINAFMDRVSFQIAKYG